MEAVPTAAPVPARNRSFEYLRAFACLFIILLHTLYSTTLMYADAFTPGRAAIADAVMNNLMWAVPCFLMVTGALLLPPEKEISVKTVWRKYIARVVRAIAVFGLAFVLLEMAFTPEKRTGAYFLRGLYRIFTGDIWSHMWYLYCLVGLYILLPFFKMITARSDERTLRYLLIVCFVFLSVLPQLEEWGVRCGFSIPVATIYPFWLLLGYYLHRYGRARSGLTCALLLIGSTAAITLLTLAQARWALPVDGLFGYSSCLVIAQAAGLAGLFFRLKPGEDTRLTRLVSRVDARSFGVYLIHMCFVRLLYKHLHFDPFAFGPAWFGGVLLVVLAAFALAYLCDWALKKIPFFRGIL